VPGDVDALKERDGGEASVVAVSQLGEPAVRHLAVAQVKLLHVWTVREDVAQALQDTKIMLSEHKVTKSRQ
jgi:hypothetical protein